MQIKAQARLIWAVGVGVALALLPVFMPHRALRGVVLISLRRHGAQPARGPFERAIQRASWYRMEAKIAVNREREVLESWDPAASGNGYPQGDAAEAWRLSELTLDRTGDLHRARALALRAAALARQPGEAYRAAELLVLIEHESGHTGRALDEARRLVKLRPRSQRAWSVLDCAERRSARQKRQSAVLAHAVPGRPVPPAP